MADPTHTQTVPLAYELWEKAGKPDCKDEEFYDQAEQELRNEDKSNPLADARHAVTDKNCATCCGKGWVEKTIPIAFGTIEFRCM